MLKKILAIALTLVTLNTYSVEPKVFQLWENDKPPVENGLQATDEKMENPRWISGVAKGELFVYPAPDPNGIALIMCPGGGYGGLSILHEGKSMAQPLNDLGVTLAVVKYRMPNQHSQVPADDVNRAYDILRENAEIWGIDPDKIGIGGASAGGHLASTIATHSEVNNFKPAFQMLLYPVISMQDDLTHKGSKTNLLGKNPTPELVAYYSNDLQVTPQTPPAFIAVSGDDTVVPVMNSINYFNALNDNGVPVSLHVYPKGNHGWGYNTELGEEQMWWKEFTYWLSTLYPNKNIPKY